jgi:hypothetical protein
MSGSELYKNYKLSPPDQVTCPGCSQIISVIAHAQTRFLGCPGCTRKISYSKESVKTVSEPNPKKLKPSIPLGRKGRLKGILWQVISFAEFREHQTIYTWKEYTLFNPIHGYAILSEYEGHWNYIRPTNDYPRYQNKKRTLDVGGRTYSAFHKYKSRFVSGIGEFNWDITNTDWPNITEFIDPPYALIKEINKDAIWWYIAEYVKPKEIAFAFDIKEPLPPRQGKGSIQMPYSSIIEPVLLKASLAFLALIFLLQILFSVIARNEVVFSEHYDLADTTFKAPIITPSFTLGHSFFGVGNLDFEIQADVDNNWFEAATTLINEDTEEEYYFEEGVEYYHGYDGGNWSEGSNWDDKILASIPDGRYHLSITPYKGEAAGKALPVGFFNLKVIRDVPSWRNFFFIAAMILLILGINRMLVNLFETGRWINSEFNEST